MQGAQLTNKLKGLRGLKIRKYDMPWRRIEELICVQPSTAVFSTLWYIVALRSRLACGCAEDNLGAVLRKLSGLLARCC